MEKALIQCVGICKTYPKDSKRVLDALTFDIHKGEILGVFGPNGAGKTTLISILCSIQQASDGSVWFYLPEKTSPKAARKFIGFVPQDFAFFPELTALQNLEYFGKMQGVPSTLLKSRIDELLQKVGLFSVKNKKVLTFSGGMKRRLNLIIALLHQPEILFLDEPTVGIDVQSKMAIISLLQELNKQNVTIVYTSHHLKEAEDFCSKIILLDHGKIVANDSLDVLLKTHNVSNLEELILHVTGKELRD